MPQFAESSSFRQAHGWCAVKMLPQLGRLGKGFAILITGSNNADALTARPLTMVMIYSAVGLRDDEMNERLGQALMTTGTVPPVLRLRRDHHNAAPACWFHGNAFCLSSN